MRVNREDRRYKALSVRASNARQNEISHNQKILAKRRAKAKAAKQARKRQRGK